MLLQINQPFDIILPGAGGLPQQRLHFAPGYDGDPDWVGSLSVESTWSVTVDGEEGSPGAVDGALAEDHYWREGTMTMEVIINHANPKLRSMTLEQIFRIGVRLREDVIISWQEATGHRLNLKVRPALYPDVKHEDGPLKRIVLTWTAADPFSYGEYESKKITVNTQTKRFSVPNQGSAKGWPRFRISGAYTNIRIRNVDTGYSLRLRNTMTSDWSYVQIITDPLQGRSVVRSDGQSLMSAVDVDDPSHSWDEMSAEPGGLTKYEVTGEGLSGVKVEWTARDTWL